MARSGYQRASLIDSSDKIAEVHPQDDLVRSTADDVLANLARPDSKPMIGLPDALCNPPGLVGKIANWISSGAPESPRGLCVFAALAFVSAIGARHYASATGTPITIYVLGIAGTGVGKDWIINAPARLISACAELKDDRLLVYPPERGEDGERSGKVRTLNAFNHLNASSNFTSDAAVFGALWESGVLYVRLDEAGDRLRNWSNPQSKESGLWAIFRECFSEGVMKPRAYAKGTNANATVQLLRRRPMIDPAITFFGVSTATQFFAAMNEDMAHDGTINRMLITLESARRPTREDIETTFFNQSRKVNRSVPELLSREIASAFMRQNTDTVTEGHTTFGLERRFDVFQAPDLKQIDWDTTESRELLVNFVHSVSDEMHDYSERADEGDCNRSKADARARIGENAIRIASILAFGDTPGDGTPRVTVEHARWAIAVMEVVKQNLSALIVDHIEADGEDLDQPLKTLLRTIDKVIDADGLVDGGAWASHSSLLRKVQSRLREPLMRAMEEAVRDGIIEKKKLYPQGKGRGSDYYRILNNWQNRPPQHNISKEQEIIAKQ